MKKEKEEAAWHFFFHGHEKKEFIEDIVNFIEQYEVPVTIPHTAQRFEISMERANHILLMLNLQGRLESIFTSGGIVYAKVGTLERLAKKAKDRREALKLST